MEYSECTILFFALILLLNIKIDSSFISNNQFEVFTCIIKQKKISHWFAVCVFFWTKFALTFSNWQEAHNDKQQHTSSHTRENILLQSQKRHWFFNGDNCQQFKFNKIFNIFRLIRNKSRIVKVIGSRHSQ